MSFEHWTTVPGIPGPEDFELDASSPRPRLLLSSQERRGAARSLPPGAIVAVELGAEGPRPPRPMIIEGRDGTPFHPHGVAMVPGTGQRPPLLHVINHVGPRRHQVECFGVEGGRLMLERPPLTGAILTDPNDLVAMPDGELYVTNSTGSVGLLGRLWSLRLRASAEAYARQATSDVTTDWAPERLAARASASLLKRTPADAITKHLTFIRGQLGRLVDTGGVEATGATITLGSAAVTVRVAAVFEKGHGLVSWVLLKDGASWKVASVTFDSDQIHLPVQGQPR